MQLWHSMQSNPEYPRCICDHEFDIKLYLGPLMEKLVCLVEEGSEDLRKTVVAAIGSAAHAAGEVRI